ncbi:uncharacterized protein SEPMUDRAFT_111062 [Sphaerulina musiva SO2202]|uniref:tRNA(Phe) (4-demethylwyosine(37)-C(7)) aminocarboxypropyltransferase n=1 Tax=Sphaerulina musiva (strain SO2202) TaxID=692275 RepID=N1QGF0_SPHMS|nr:uncharacterized protein SEPMUDRAFT_111062 [Sphaerulina musiva SO2202]EMF09608.1 hypothetical protein SEPMUDRAFT_111062 [Sphaerulina musiva SO2202]
MDRAVEAWRLQHGIEKEIIAPLSKKLCKSYTVYGCMLLLPQNALEGPEWSPLEPLIHHNNINNNNTALNDLYKSIAKELKITHIASNKPIPLHHPHPHHPHPPPHPPPANVTDTCNDNNNNNETTPTSSENILRAPINFTPLYGDFGPETCSQPHPTQEDFDKAFWVTAKQNGIYQVWAPRWTMFSRGNISEKARLLTLGSVREAVEDAAVRGGREGGEEEEEEERELQPPGFAAIDLYAGIGYFAFSYLRAGADQVWCWDINPWSIEGLLRGAKANKWEAVLLSHGMDHFDGDLLQETATTSMSKETLKKGIRKAKLLIFNESNIHAPERLQQYLFPPPPPLPQPHHHPPQITIRHINLGLLPSSRESLSLAAQILSLQHQQQQITSTRQKEDKSKRRRRKGSTSWIHMHENFLLEEILAKANERSKELEEKIHGFLSIIHYQKNITWKERNEMEGEEKRKKEREKRTSRVRVKIEGINRLKSYAPGVMHCVVDFGVEFLEEEGEEREEGQEEEEGGEGEDGRR